MAYNHVRRIQLKSETLIGKSPNLKLYTFIKISNAVLSQTERKSTRKSIDIQ